MTAKRYPMRCSIRAQADATRVDVYDDIGPGGFFADGLTAKDFAASLSGVSGPLDVHLNSGGGDVFDGLAICSAIRAHKGPKRTVVDGIAASIASVIFQAGDERVVEPGGMVMIHDPFTMAVGNAAELRTLADTLDKHGDNIADQYARRSGKPADHWREVMKAETWFTAGEAVEAGLADKVGSGSAELPAGFDATVFDAVPGRVAAALRSMPQAAAPDPYDGDDPCPTCKGKKTIRGGNMTCPDCKGTGQAPAGGAAAQDRAQDAAQADGDDGGATSAPKCRTCKGKGRLPHPVTGKNGAQCPSCGGSGFYAPDGGDGAQDAAAGRPQGGAQPGACCEMCGPDCSCTAAGTAMTDDRVRAILRDEVARMAKAGPGGPENSTGKSVFGQRLEQMRGALPSLIGAEE